jgi:DivIVA domain-containing protein
MARVKRATSQLVRWHSEYEDALSEAHDLGVPDRALADAGAPRIPATSRTPTAPSRNPGAGDGSGVGDDERSEPGPGDREPFAGAPEQRRGLGEFRDHVPAEIRDVSFPTAVRGYDRRAVDAYVKRVNRLIAELEVGSSPQAAVRNALDRVGVQTAGILQQAREAAEEITAGAAAEAEQTTGRAKTEAEKINASARAEADETTRRAKAETEEILARSRSEAAERLQRAKEELEALREQADARMRTLTADTEAIWQERGELVDEIRQLAGRLEEIASGAAARFPDRQVSEQTPDPSEDGDDESPVEKSEHP